VHEDAISTRRARPTAIDVPLVWYEEFSGVTSHAGRCMQVPKVKMFKHLNKKWKKPLSLDLTNNIKDKRRTWNSFIKTRNPAILLKYKKLSDSIRDHTRNLQKKNKAISHINVKPILKNVGTM